MNTWHTTINTGDPNTDWHAVRSYQSQCMAMGYAVEVYPLPTGGYHVRAVVPAAVAPITGHSSQYGSSPVQQHHGSMQYAAAPAHPTPQQPQYQRHPTFAEENNLESTLVVPEGYSESLLSRLPTDASASKPKFPPSATSGKKLDKPTSYALLAVFTMAIVTSGLWVVLR